MANTTYSEVIRNIITSTVKLDGFTDEEKSEIVEFLEDNCVMQIHIDILSKLSKEDRNTFYEINEKQKPPEIKAFLERKLPDYKDIAQDAARKTVQEFIRLQQS